MSNILNLVAFIVAIVILYRLAVLYIDRRHASRRSDEVHAQVIERCRQLEERVRVLERIVTDRSVDLERQFDELGG